MSISLDTRILKFGAVGLAGMIIDFSTTWVCKEKIRLNQYLSNSLGFCFAVTSNFMLNRYWTFENTMQPFTEQFVKFIIVSLRAFAI